MLQGAAQRGAQFYFIFAVLRTLFSCSEMSLLSLKSGARLRGRTATQRSKKGSEKVLERVLGKGSQKGSEKGVCCGFYSRRWF